MGRLFGAMAVAISCTGSRPGKKKLRLVSIAMLEEPLLPGDEQDQTADDAVQPVHPGEGPGAAGNERDERDERQRRDEQGADRNQEDDLAGVAAIGEQQIGVNAQDARGARAVRPERENRLKPKFSFIIRYFSVSFLLVVGLAYYALASFDQFFPAVEYLGASRVSLFLLGNLGFSTSLVGYKGACMKRFHVDVPRLLRVRRPYPQSSLTPIRKPFIIITSHRVPVSGDPSRVRSRACPRQGGPSNH